TLAVEIANEHGLKGIAHMPGGFRAWKAAGGAVESID
ncbi:MAG: rhodanese-like domain-containing protein, partial [Roseibium sp.]|nr:rhodanese-like domain-containing protein [Roseibium sp.]